MPQNTPGGSIRPVTSKARGFCKYYATERGCFAGDKCKFLHSAPKLGGETNVNEPNEPPLLTPYDQTKRCKFFDQGNRRFSAIKVTDTDLSSNRFL
jgi:hypothetical protein